MARLWIEMFVNHAWLTYINEVSSATNVYVMILRRALCTDIGSSTNEVLLTYLLRLQFYDLLIAVVNSRVWL